MRSAVWKRMNSKYLARISIFAVAAALVAVATFAYFNRDDDTSATGNDRTQVIAPIESVDILTLESFPPQYTAQIVSGLPSGCAAFEKAEVTGRSGNTITIRVTNTMPADPNVACTAIYGMHESNVSLGSDFTSGQTYTVDVNGTIATFVAQ